MDKHKSTLYKIVFTIFALCSIAMSAYASMIDYGVYQVKAAILGDDQHPSLTKIDNKAPGLWGTGASAHVEDSYGTVSTAWSISPLTPNEAQINIYTSYMLYGSSTTYRNSSASQAGEVHFNYHSDTPFTVIYYWDLTWGIDHPTEFLNLNFYAQSVRLRIYDSMDNWWDPQWLPPPPQSRYYPFYGNTTGSTSIEVGAGDWLFIVWNSGSKSRWDGEWETLSGNVYLDFDGGERALYKLSGTASLSDYSGTVEGVPVAVQLLTQDNSSVLRSEFPTLDASGKFEMEGVAPGTYNLSVKPEHWLNETITGITVTDADVDLGSINFFNGDCDNDNEITSTDLSVILTAMDSVEGDVNWDPSADLDGDGDITSTDLSIVLANMDMPGD